MQKGKAVLLPWLLLPFLALTAAAPVWLSECRAKGFTPGQLPCGSCETIKTALGGDAAHPSVDACLACCSPTLDYANKRFSRAVLRVCRAQASGGVGEWLEKRAEAWEARGVKVEDSCAGLAGMAGMGGLNFGGSMGGFAGMGGLPGMSEPPALVLFSGEGATPPPSPPPPKKAAPKKTKAAAAAPPSDGKRGVEVGVQAIKVEHIDAFLEKHLAAAE